MTICHRYYALYQQLSAALAPADLPHKPPATAIREICAQMSAHIHHCPACQERLAWAKGKVADARNVLDQTLR